MCSALGSFPALCNVVWNRAIAVIKFTAEDKDGKRILGLGLVEGNLKHLRNGKPIKIDGKSVGLDNLDIIIFYGKTEDSLAKQLAPFITAHTKFKDYR